MSWLFIDSVALMCDTCEWSYIVNLQDRGAIQIGDDNIAFLYQLYCEKLGVSHSDSVMNEFLNTFHTMPLICICQNGYATMKNASRQQKIDRLVQDIMNCLDEIQAIFNDYSEKQEYLNERILEGFLEQIDEEWTKNVNEKVYSRTLGHSQFGNPTQRTRLIKQYVAEAKKEILERAWDYYSEATANSTFSSNYQQKIDELYRRSMSTIEKLQKIHPDFVVFFYEHADKTQPLNLNNYLCYEGTLGYPVDQTGDYDVYFPKKINISKILQWLEEHKEIEPIAVGDKKIINSVRKKLQKIFV